MADKFLNLTAVQTIKTWATGLFAKGEDLNALETKVDEIISEGGEPNVIETVKVNSRALTPDAQKAVDIIVPTKMSDLLNDGDGTGGSRFSLLSEVPTKTSDLNNDGDGQSNFATEAYVQQNGGKIDTISVNGTQQTITNKNVDITVPTDVSDLANDSGYQTAADVQSAINTAVASAYKYKGSVATQSALPSSGQTVGDVWDVQDTGVNYAWTGTAWDALGSYVDTSVLWTSVTGQTNTLEAATVAEINAILNA